MPAMRASCAANWLVSVTLRPILMSVFSGVGSAPGAADAEGAALVPADAADGAALVPPPPVQAAAKTAADASNASVRECFAIFVSSSSMGRRQPGLTGRRHPGM